MNKLLSDKKAICFFLFPTLLLMTVIVIVPIFISSYYSLLEWDGIGKSTFIGLQNYLEIFKDERFINSVKNSMLFVVMSLFIQLPFSLLIALVIANGVKGEKIYRTIYFIPVIISTVVIGQMWQKIYNSDYGLLNTVLRSLGLDNAAQDWLGRTDRALICSFVPILWQYVGYHMLIMYAGIKGISDEINEAAIIDGANKFQIAWRITIPILNPILKVCVTFSLIGALKVIRCIKKKD